MEKLKTLLGTIEELGKAEYEEGIGENVEIEDILEAMKIVGTEERSEEVLDEIENPTLIYKSLLNIAFASFQTKNPRKCRISLRFLVNLTQRSRKFASKIPSEVMDVLESLLAIGEFDKEVLMILLKTAEFSYLEFQKGTGYSNLLKRVVDSFYWANGVISEEGSSNDEAPLALGYFSILLEKDYAILAHLYAEMEPATFCRILEILEVLLEQKKGKIHQNNLLFILNLLELICRDFEGFLDAQSKKSAKNRDLRRANSLEMVKLLVGLVGEMAQNVEMTSKLNEDTVMMECCIDVLDTVLHTEGRFGEFREEKGLEWPEISEGMSGELKKAILEERRIEGARRKQEGRPRIPPPNKLQRVAENQSLDALSDVFLEFYQNVSNDYGQAGDMKLNCLKAIANLCNLSIENKLAATRNGRMGLLSVLQCTRRRPLWFLESFAIHNWAIFCVRQLTDECNENKEVILNLEQPNQPIIDREKLLKEFGLRAEKGADQKMHLKRIDEEE